MTYTKLIEQMRVIGGNCVLAADAIEALQSKLGDAIRSLANWQHQCTELQAENERLKAEREALRDSANEVVRLREQLQSRLDAMGKGEAVAYRAWFDADNGARWLFTLWPEEERLNVEWEPLYAAPKALAPLTDEQIEHLVDISYKHWQDKTTFDIAAVRADFRAHGIGGTP